VPRPFYFKELEQMVRVKICGITNIKDARHAIACGADALGFVFYSGSPRHVSAEKARSIIAALPPMVTTVGLFVNETPDRVRMIAKVSGIDVIQLHGDESPSACNYSPYRVIKALRVKDAESVEKHSAYRTSGLLLDAWCPDSYGGTGKSFDWDLAADISRKRPVILAGGLTPENVGDAVVSVQPWAVDVSSGVEISPGKKDPELVAAFIRNAKCL
jgi:phosphoribosylanthranilate isomerase